MNNRTRPIDIVTAGELLIDFMSTDFADDLKQVQHFQRFQGGSPANLAMNMARLGNIASLVASVGADDMGDFLIESVANVGVHTDYIARISQQPTTLILVTRSKNISNFEVYRGADAFIAKEQLPDHLLAKTFIFHTTCFGISKSMSQTSILEAAERAANLGCQLSLDVNYANKVWSDPLEARQLVQQYCSHSALVKVSEVDWERLYGSAFVNPEEAGTHFLSLGAKAVCVTMGSAGLKVFSATESYFLPSRPVEVKDTTGAGDAFWSGFLTAWIDGHTLLQCAKAGRRMAEYKLGYLGNLPSQVDKMMIYQDI
jgi:fructokinase